MKKLEKALIVGLALTTVCVAINILSQKDKQEVDQYLGEYQEEAYPIGQQEEDYQNLK
ncbi:MAG: hypothetical protein JGK33_08955 [Microcoleus sp. PH2017_11_PCY_U_A]|uniref:hypothetical protein n=1 Tax=unclassified Microcoleus TaxID=2642155 RepID=UPI001E15C220|nr:MULTISPECIES: hypothetical protein [unclassified Microcoleus]MCC3459787.1 hypothetical protein [Microcoleus sp. PH2017_11_PCY_U_A]MCC3478220.1 hypothetical protein [Microcoleus sp. PH2017_12_PCY_D_A]